MHLSVDLGSNAHVVPGARNRQMDTKFHTVIYICRSFPFYLKLLTCKPSLISVAYFCINTTYYFKVVALVYHFPQTTGIILLTDLFLIQQSLLISTTFPTCPEVLISSLLISYRPEIMLSTPYQY